MVVGDRLTADPVLGSMASLFIWTLRASVVVAFQPYSRLEDDIQFSRKANTMRRRRITLCLRSAIGIAPEVRVKSISYEIENERIKLPLIVEMICSWIVKRTDNDTNARIPENSR